METARGRAGSGGSRRLPSTERSRAAANAGPSARHMRTSEARTGSRIDEVLTRMDAKSGRTHPMTCVSHRWVPSRLNNVRNSPNNVALHRERIGRPLVLLHGIGMSGSAWNSVMPYLGASRRLIVFDIAGFGLTPPLPAGTPPTSANSAAALERLVRAMGVDWPVDIAGNSLGGLIALEAAKRGLARSVVAISPPGLWRDHGAPHVKCLFWTLRSWPREFRQP